VKNNKYVVGNKASVCTWELTFSFLCKKQVDKFIRLLLKDCVDMYTITFEVWSDYKDNRDNHYVTVSSSWAHNITRVAKMLEKVDYKMSTD
jgi:hypothetical protein